MTTRRYDDGRLILPAMTTTNPPAAHVHSEIGRSARPECGARECSCTPPLTIPVPVPIGEAITGASITANNIFVSTLKAPEPQLTVKQAAKAYRKAVRAHEAAVQAHRDADRAATEARNAKGRAAAAVEAARVALEKAAAR